MVWPETRDTEAPRDQCPREAITILSPEGQRMKAGVNQSPVRPAALVEEGPSQEILSSPKLWTTFLEPNQMPSAGEPTWAQRK